MPLAAHQLEPGTVPSKMSAAAAASSRANAVPARLAGGGGGRAAQRWNGRPDGRSGSDEAAFPRDRVGKARAGRPHFSQPSKQCLPGGAAWPAGSAAAGGGGRSIEGVAGPNGLPAASPPLLLPPRSWNSAPSLPPAAANIGLAQQQLVERNIPRTAEREGDNLGHGLSP